MKLSIVIPVCREEAVLSATHERVPRLLGELSGRGLIEDYEVLCIDDGSRDNSLGILRELAQVSKGKGPLQKRPMGRVFTFSILCPLLIL